MLSRRHNFGELGQVFNLPHIHPSLASAGVIVELGLEKKPVSPKLEVFTKSTQFHGGNRHGLPL
jgi:hypothetical protein